MSQNSKIEWTDTTWNPIRGCTKVSPGCQNCYAETFAERFRGVPSHPFEQGFDLRMVPEKLVEPLRWANPRMVFVNSMSDLFHEDIPEDYIKEAIEMMYRANWHTYQVLTKRSFHMMEILSRHFSNVELEKHIWWGVSVEDRQFGMPRIENLRNTPAAVRFLSIEPLLEDLGVLDLTGIDWVIVGGESGPKARPMELDWVLSIQKQCYQAKVPFFFKQWGGVQKSKNGRQLLNRTYDEFPERIQNTPASVEERQEWIAELIVSV